MDYSEIKKAADEAGKKIRERVKDLLRRGDRANGMKSREEAVEGITASVRGGVADSYSDAVVIESDDDDDRSGPT